MIKMSTLKKIKKLVLKIVEMTIQIADGLEIFGMKKLLIILKKTVKANKVNQTN